MIRERNEFLFKAILRHLCENEGLLKHLLNLKRKSENYRSLLHISGFYSEQMFNDILNSEIFQRIEELDIDRRTALHIACLEGKENSVESYLKKIQYKSESSIVNKTDIYDCTPLLLAVQNESIKIIKLLLDHGASLGAKNGLGKTALMFASEKSNFETVKFLIEQGADINETDACGKTALMYAFENKKEEENIVRYLVQKGADINKRTDCGTTALMCTNETNICSDNIDTLKFLIQYGADINAIDSLGRRIYMRGNISRSIVALKYLVELGVNVANEVDAKGDTCLIQCAEHGAIINHRNKEGNSALHFVAKNYKVDVMQLLVENGADIYLKNNVGITPF
ncbi:hypothetical protein B566_EDAN000845 [Ephemera danica]|nr:hypothetical protein B566_EDAN000845 [Ephemera danica]